MNQHILIETLYKVDPNGHGGNHRTGQITELVKSAELEVYDIQNRGDIGNIKTTRWSRYAAGIQLLAKHHFKVSPSYQMIGRCGHLYQVYRNVLNQNQDINANLILWEATKKHVEIYSAKDAGFKIVAIPQNLESLVVDYTDPFTGKSLPESLENEIKHLANSDAVFSISREEQWLLKLFGIDADFLPYYPPSSILSNLLHIRELRNYRETKRFLILGTFFNPPTRLGMIEQVQWLARIKKDISFEIDIAGYGTEQLKDYCNDLNFTIHGTVDSEKLNYLLTNAKAVLIHQKAGVGALTRIPEMLMAGIPVIANGNACRSAFSYPGVYCYDNEAELADLMTKNLDSPSLLPRPLAAEKRFINCLKKLVM
jgi:hypothetical protein